MIDIESLVTPGADAAEPLLVERRRPGRQDVSPELVAMLRSPESVFSDGEAPDWSMLEPVDAMRSMRGIVMGLLLAVPFWVAVGVAVWLIVR